MKSSLSGRVPTFRSKQSCWTRHAQSITSKYLSILKEDIKTCRICGASELAESFTNGFDIIGIAGEIYPVTQKIDKLLNAVGQTELARHEHKSWREAVSSRCGVLQFPRNGDEEHLPLRYCECPPCRQDRTTFRESLQPLLTPFESDVLDVCDRMEPVIRTAVDQARKNALATTTETDGWTDARIESLQEHVSSCVNVTFEERQTCRMIEGALGFALYALRGTLRSLEDSAAFKYGILPFIVRSIHSIEERHGTLFDEVRRATESIIDTWSSEIREARERHTANDEEIVSHVFEVARLYVMTSVLEQLKLDCFSSNISTSR